MTACDRTDVHGPHFWNLKPISVSEFRNGVAVVPASVELAKCPGWEGTTPDRERATLDTPDWTPETLHLSDAAAWIVVCHQSIDEAPTNYRAAMNVWERLTGMDEATALTFAFQIATLDPPVTAVAVPF